MAGAALKQVGVEAVVAGLSKFVGDVGILNKSIKSIGSEGTLLDRILGGLGSAFGYLADKIINVAVYALGQLLANAISAVLAKIGELARAVFEAGAEFQILELRLNRLNFNTVFGDIENYNEAMQEATRLTKEQLGWVQKIAVTTPYDAQDIANVFTLARSYGFAADMAQNLTVDITDFAAGMGLGNTEIERIIVNFGQMVQQGKVTQRELNDLARGSFVPVNDVLKLMQENLGMTDAEFEKFRYTGEGVNAFMTAFSQLVKTRFAGAGQDMARTFQGATANAQDFLKSLIGFNIVRPILDRLGGGIADFITSLTAEGTWDRLNEAAARVGQSFGLVLDIFQQVLGLNTGSLAEGLIGGLNGIADWINNNRGKIYSFFTGIRDTITDKVIPFIRDRLIPAFQEFGGWLVRNAPKAAAFFEGLMRNAQRVGDWIKRNVVTAFDAISEWVTANRPLIDEFFKTLGEIISTVVYDLTHIDISEGGLQGFLDGISSFMQWIIDNKEGIADFVTRLIELWAIFQVGLAVIGVLVTAFTTLLGVIGLLAINGIAAITELSVIIIQWVTVTLAAIQTWAVEAVTAINTWVANSWLAVQTWSANVVSTIQTWAAQVINTINAWVESMAGSFGDFVAMALAKWEEFKQNAISAAKEAIHLIQNLPWGTLGRNIIAGIATGIKHAAHALINELVAAAEAAIAAVYEKFGIASPSKVMKEVGVNLMVGMAQGIKKTRQELVDEMLKSMEAVSAPALNMPALVTQYASAPSTVNNTTSYTNNFALTVNSNSAREPLLQDYNMMQSLLGG